MLSKGELFEARAKGGGCRRRQNCLIVPSGRADLDRYSVAHQNVREHPGDGRLDFVRHVGGIPTNGSPEVTASPAFLNHRPTDNFAPTFSIIGTRISVIIEVITQDRDFRQ